MIIYHVSRASFITLPIRRKKLSQVFEVVPAPTSGLVISVYSHQTSCYSTGIGFSEKLTGNTDSIECMNAKWHCAIVNEALFNAIAVSEKM